MLSSSYWCRFVNADGASSYKATLNVLKINPKLHKKVIDYRVEITHQQKKEILKSLDPEISNILRYGNRNPNIWN